jgi:ribosome-associated translation inhibitor RaiA
MDTKLVISHTDVTRRADASAAAKLRAPNGGAKVAVRSGIMQIVVTSQVAALEDQTRAYAEYKVFSSLAPRARAIDRVEVLLAEQSSGQNGSETECAVTVHLAGGGSVHAKARASGAYAAIDRAALRIETDMNRRTARPLSS